MTPSPRSWFRRSRSADSPAGGADAAPDSPIGIKKGREHLDGEEGIRALGHREHIGGRWEEIGQLQFDFLVSQGLRPEHFYLDIACGSLRGGVHLIPYLQPGHYMGVEKEALLVELGVREELGEDVAARQRPEFVISSDFEFDKLSSTPDYALAQSLFSHLPKPAIARCLEQLRPVIAPTGVFFATFNEVDAPVPNPEAAHDWGHFQYVRADIEQLARDEGWNVEYIGDWGHPRNQRMLRLTPA